MIVLDTNVASELMRPEPATAVSAWVRARRIGELCTTAISLAEILYGIELLPDGRNKSLLSAAAAGLFSTFPDQVLAFDARAAAEYAVIVSHREQAGRPIGGFDAQIAAVCRARRAPLATRNVRDFADTGVDLIDPWNVG